MEVHVLKNQGVSLCGERVAFYNLVSECDYKLVTCKKCLSVCKQGKDGEEIIPLQRQPVPITVVNFPFSPIQVKP